jgi:hypothetical protein
MATKKSSATADKYQKLFDATPYSALSRFELENFIASTTSVNFPRKIIEVVNKIRELESTVTESEFQRKANEATAKTFRSWLDSYDIDKLCSEVNSWEDKETNYWIDTLGKTAAIEIISVGTISKATIEKMTMLPEEGYVKATQLCVKLANAIKGATVKAEEAIGVKAPPPAPKEESTPPVKAGFKLKRP